MNIKINGDILTKEEEERLAKLKEEEEIEPQENCNIP